MKILGLTRNGEIILKPDSALVVNRKPFFRPDYVLKPVLHPCLVVRISRLGKNIAERFAHRYYDGITHGLNIEDETQNDYIRRWAFDNSLIVGEIVPITAPDPSNGNDTMLPNSFNLPLENWRAVIATAIANISQYITIRMGDLLFIELDEPPIAFEQDKVITANMDGHEVLYCKLK